MTRSPLRSRTGRVRYVTSTRELKWRAHDQEMMADGRMGLLGEDKARREEWRAAHPLLSVSVPVPVPENLTRLLHGTTAPPLPLNPRPS